MEFLILIGIALLALGGVGVAGYFLLRWLFVRAAEGMARHIAQRLEQLARTAASTRAGQTTAELARYLAQRRWTRLDVYAAAEHVSEDAARQQFADSIERVARIMDAAIKLPVVGPVGVDALLGLVPVVGDVISAAVATSLVAKSLRYGVPRELLTKMLANVLVDLLLGAVPVVGDLADAWFRANTRNVALLRRYLNESIEIWE